MIHVIAIIELHPGCREAFLDEFHQVVPAVLAEPGCLAYGPTVDVATDIGAQAPLGTDAVCVVEQWESTDALAAHLVAPHVNAYRERVRDYVRNVRLHILQPA